MIPREPLRRHLTLVATLALAQASVAGAQPTVSGTVLDPSLRPIAGARIELLPVPSNFEAGLLRLEGRRIPPAAAARSDSAGRFVIPAPGTGVFIAVVRSDGRVPMQSATLPLVEAEELPPVLLWPDAGAALQVVDRAGRPLVGAWVFADSVESGRLAGNGWRVELRVGQTGEDGSLTLPRLEGEELDVAVHPVDGLEERAFGVEGGTVAAPRDTGHRCPIRVVTSEGRPAAGVLVRAGGLSWPVGITDGEGRLEVPCEAGGSTTLRLVAREGSRWSAELTGAGNREGTTIVEPGAMVVVGRLTSGGAPLAGALVWASADPGGLVITDAGGSYRLVAPEAPFELLAVASGHLSGSVRVTRAHVRSGRAPALALTPAVALPGEVVDAQGAAVAGVTLAAVAQAGPGAPSAEIEHASTGPAGRFELRGLAAGRGYQVLAFRPGYLPATVRAVAPEPPAPAALLRIALSPGRSARGRVLDAEGRAVPGAQVQLAALREPGPLLPLVDPEAEPGMMTARTDGEGRFAVAQVPANPLDLTVRKPGFAPSLLRGVRVPPGAGAFDLGEITLHPGVRLAGRVVDGRDRPIGGAEIFLVLELKRVYETSRILDGELAAATSDGKGRFVIEDLPGGTSVDLLVRSRGFLPGSRSVARLPTPQPLEVRLEAASLLRARVIDEERRPIAGAQVDLTLHSARPISRSARSGRDGRVEIADVPMGRGTVSTTAPGFVPIEDLEVSLPRPEPEAELIVTLEKGATLSGRVSLTDGAPVPGARIAVAGVSGTSDDEGYYTAEGVAPGTALVTMSHRDHRRFVQEMVIEPGANLLDVTLEPGVEVVGRVVDELGEAVAAAWVRLASLTQRDLEYRARASADGTFRLTPVDRGRYRLQAGHADYPPAELKRPVIVSDEPVSSIEVALVRGGDITGQVLGLEREDLYRVRVTAESGGKTHAGVLDSEGRYEVRRLQPGDYLLRASLVIGRRLVLARVPLEPGEPVERDLEFVSRLTLSGRVLHGEEPLIGAALTLRGSRLAIERSAVTDHLGDFRIEDLEPDLYSLGLSHPAEHLVHNENLDLTEDLEVVIRLRAATVSGVVQDGASGAGVAGALILLRHAATGEVPEFLVSGGSQEDGSFHLPQVPAGLYRATVSAAGYAAAERELAVPAGEDEVEMEVRLEPTQGVDVRVRLASGEVPGVVHLRVLAASGAAVVAESRSPDTAGVLRLATVPEGSWQLLLGAAGGSVVATPLSVPGVPVEVELPAAGRLLVRVPALASTNLIASLRVSDGQQPFWTLAPGGAIQDQWPVVAGSGTVDGLPAGLWLLSIEAPDGRRWSASASTPGTSEVSIALE